MEILSCSHPQRVKNKYTGDFVWVPCGKCAKCRNRKAAYYSSLLEAEASQHPYNLFVTLTYNDRFLPVLTYADFVQRGDCSQFTYVSSRERDSISIPFTDFFPDDKKDEYDIADINYLQDRLENGGLPYASWSDIELFLKRLNKYFFDNVTHTYQNFRYWIVSELGSTTFRPHFHGIFFVDNQRCAEKFADAVSACWEYRFSGKNALPLGKTDCQFVASSAYSYVAQYVGKSDDLPYVYENRQIRPNYRCSRRPFIGTFTHRSEDDKELVNQSSVETYVSRKKDGQFRFINVPLQQGRENRLFPKCPCYCSLSDYVRTQFYSTIRRFSKETLAGFINDVYSYVFENCYHDEFRVYLRQKLSFRLEPYFELQKHDPVRMFDETSFNFLRRWFYFARRVSCQACQFGLSIMDYAEKIINHYNNKALYCLRKFYECQQIKSETDSDSIAAMYPEFLFKLGTSCITYVRDLCCNDVLNDLQDAEFKQKKNKKCHFKNAYLDSLELKRSSYNLYLTIKNYLYAKKRYEAIEAVAA